MTEICNVMRMFKYLVRHLRPKLYMISFAYSPVHPIYQVVMTKETSCLKRVEVFSIQILHVFNWNCTSFNRLFSSFATLLPSKKYDIPYLAQLSKRLVLYLTLLRYFSVAYCRYKLRISVKTYSLFWRRFCRRSSLLAPNMK